MKTVQASVTAVFSCACLVLVKLTQCSNIFAELDVVRYCTNQRSLCQDTGSFIHIVCQYYGKVGSSCSRFNEVPLEDGNENAILFRINTMRILAAKGKAIGQSQQKLPRAYGMKKVFWDSELAAFAKIMIHQCISKHRYSCAASKTFTSPIMAYTSANTTSSAANIIDNIFSTWESDAFTTTANEIFHSPDLKGGESRFYIKMVVGDVTHVGCAAGVYEHEIRPIAIKPKDNIRLAGHMICYLSHYSREGTPVYNTTEPVRGTGWTKCGCPPKYRETKNCLCVPNPRSTTESPQFTELAEKTDLLHLKSEKQREHQKLQWSPHVTLAPKMQEFLEPKIRQKLEETQYASKGLSVLTPECRSGGRCEAKIVMLPILTIQNAPKLHSRKKERGFYRRSVNSSSVPMKAIDDVKFSDENNDELPQNMSIRSKLLETMRKIRNKQAADIFSNENADHGQYNIERSLITVEPTKRTMKPHLTTNKRSHDDHTENAKKTVLNLLELLEEGKFVEPVQSIAEPSHQITKWSRGVRNDKAKKRIMHLLDLLEEKAVKAQLNSREMVEFDVKMRRIYKSVVGRPHDESDFIKTQDSKSLLFDMIN